jgi:hypothetical protein
MGLASPQPMMTMDTVLAPPPALREDRPEPRPPAPVELPEPPMLLAPPPPWPPGVYRIDPEA